MPKNNQTSSMVEAGILSAVAIVFALINIYVPLLGVFLNVFWPVPIIILGVRHGLRWSALALFTAGVIIALLVNPLDSLFLVVRMGFIGLVLGWSIHQGKSPMVILGMGSIVSFLSKLLIFALSFWLMGVNPLEISADFTTGVTDDVLAFYRSMGIPEAELERGRLMIAALLETMKMVLPAGIIMASFFDTFINFWLAKKILVRLGTFVPGLPAFRELILPQPVLLFYGLSTLAVYLPPFAGYYRIAGNFNVLCMMLLLTQGLAVGWFYIHKFLWRGLLIMSLFILPFMTMVMLLLGIADFVADFRKLRPDRRSP